MKIKQNIDEMHVLFGQSSTTSKDSKSILREGYHYRCRKWGEHSEWSKDFQACNLWESRYGLE